MSRIASTRASSFSSGWSLLLCQALLFSQSLFFCEVTALSAEDWARFRGPNGSGISNETVPTTWSDTENLKWKTPLPGYGSSSPIIVGDKVFVTCYSGYGTEGGGNQENLRRHLVCVNRVDGKILWDKTVNAILPEDDAQGFLNEHGYASSTPTSDGERVYVFYGKSGALAYDLEGNQLWQVSLGTQSSNRRWGSAASPILYQDLVIINASEESLAIYALDKKTGEVKWKSPGDTLELSYSTPILVEQPNGKTELVVQVANEVWGLNPENGKLKWFAQVPVPGNASPSAVAHDGVVYVTGGRGGGSAAVKTGGRGDVTATHVVWTSNQGSYVPSPVVHDGKLYWVDEKGLAVCLDAATGKEVYRQRIRGNEDFRGNAFYSSVGLIGDKLYAVSRRAGTFVYAPGEKFEQLAQNQFADDATDANASPAVCGGNLFIRTNKYLYCVGK
ncbi:MAG: PQQ-binding-like beta-propeller repeat protein [Pirellulales bacterium]|nr:PQQ-binding-like beta-propeller repeat protein [Pirellulales bacterium]